MADVLDTLRGTLVRLHLQCRKSYASIAQNIGIHRTTIHSFLAGHNVTLHTVTCLQQWCERTEQGVSQCPSPNPRSFLC